MEIALTLDFGHNFDRHYRELNWMIQEPEFSALLGNVIDILYDVHGQLEYDASIFEPFLSLQFTLMEEDLPSSNLEHLGDAFPCFGGGFQVTNSADSLGHC